MNRGFGTEVLFIVALGLVVLGSKRLHILLAHVARAKAEFDKASRGIKFQLAAQLEGAPQDPNMMTNPCCPERQMAQPMSRIHSRSERAGSLWRNSKLDQKCAF